MNILVTGATGLIGSELCQRLEREGHSLTILSRRPLNQPGRRAFVWDPVAGPPPSDSLNGIDAVIYLAGESVAGGRWTEAKKRRIRDSRVLGVRNLINGISLNTSRPAVFISASAVGFYGDRGEEILDELSAPGTGFLSEVCVEWESAANHAESLGLRVVCVRTGLVLSASGGALAAMKRPFKLALGAILGDGSQWMPWIHIEDIVGLYLHALLKESITGAVNGCAVDAARNSEFTRALARALARPSFLVAPSFALKLILGEMSEIVLMSDRVIPRRAMETGFQFRHLELTAALEDLLK